MNKNLEYLFDSFKKTVEDNKMSTSEKKAISKLLDDYDLSGNQVDLLRNKIYSIARDKVTGHENRRIIDWLMECSKILYKSEDLPYNEVYFSPGEDCLNAIISNLKMSVYKVDICVFTISDNRISDEIMNCYKRGINVRIITDDYKTRDTGSDIIKLSNAGIKIKVDDSQQHMHNKFAVIDEKRVITGSYNWTRQASEMNYENILITNEYNALQCFTDEFNSLWEKMKDY